MKIGIAQIQPRAGDLEYNIRRHIEAITQAAQEQADALFFSELSLTGYEPALASTHAMTLEDERLAPFHKLSQQHNITLGIGLPLLTNNGIQIAMLICQPNATPQIYGKQLLHDDEKPFFVPGHQQVMINIHNYVIGPAICYESLHETHLQNVISKDAHIYLASVAKSASGTQEAYASFSNFSKKYNVPILMVNSLGPCDNFVAAGQSSIWSSEGILMGQLSSDDEAILIFDVENSAHKSFLV